MSKTLIHEWGKNRPNPGDKIRRLNESSHKGMKIGQIYTIKTINSSAVHVEECKDSYSINFFEPADIPISQLVKTENYQIF